MPIVTIDGFPISYAVHGSGPVCFAHPGGPGFDAGYLHSAELERAFTVVYLDPIGTGASAQLPAGELYSRDRDVAILEGVRAALGHERMHVLGHSYGGYIAQLYALAFPERLVGLILYATSPTTGPDWQDRRAAGIAKRSHEPWFDEAMRGLDLERHARSQSDLDLALSLYAPLYFERWTERADAYRRALARSTLAFDVKMRRPATPVFDIRDRLASITARTLVIGGEHDAISDADWSRELARAIPDARLAVIAGTGHFPHVEDPAAFGHALAELGATRGSW